jgi:limonene-1,2-epoxide hydrolase
VDVSKQSNEQIIRDFIAAWSNLDVDELVSYFTEDGTYFNIPSVPVQGVDNLRTFIGGLIAKWTKTDWDIVSLLADGNLVMVERLDRTVVADKKVDLPCFGVFEMQEGKIKVWRDYFDMNTFVSAIS